MCGMHGTNKLLALAKRCRTAALKLWMTDGSLTVAIASPVYL
jgi:hypothetical protein